jgi:hypothetical protein
MKYEIPLMLKQGNRRVGKENCLKQTGEYLAVEVPQCAVNSTTLGQNRDRWGKRLCADLAF